MKAHINDIQTIYSDIPKKWNVNGSLVFNYNLLTDQHFTDGWRDVVLPNITELQKYSESYILVDDVVTKEVIDLTNEEISLLTLKKESDSYINRMTDGKKMYAEISAEFRLAKLSGMITEEQHEAIEDALIPVRNEVLAGQWISALQKLEEIGVSVGSELYQRLHTQITNYINENY